MQDSIIARQRMASDPSSSVYISASAGSGKTKVLIDRVLRLLISGTAMPSILCITYTTAAASEIHQRIEDKLRQWFTCDEGQLQQEISDLCGSPATELNLHNARILYFDFLNPQQSLKIKTLHAFCLELLQKKANNASNIQAIAEQELPSQIFHTSNSLDILDDYAKKELIEAALHEIIFHFAQNAGDDLQSQVQADAEKVTKIAKDNLLYSAEHIGYIGDKIQLLLNKYEINNLINIIYEIISIEPDLFSNINSVNFPESINQIQAQVCKTHFISQLYSHDALLAKALKDDDTAIEPIFAELKNIYASLDAADPEATTILSELIGHLDNFTRNEWQEFSAFCNILLTNELTPRARLPIKAHFLKNHSKLEDLLRNLQAKLHAICQKLHQNTQAEYNEALAILVLLVQRQYLAHKTQLSCLDYNDIIRKTLEHLAETHGNSAALYSIDLNLQHLLVDEAQDLSAGQWYIIKSLTSDFFSGIGASSEQNKSIFIVGDFKQSIFSFQGAKPELFEEARSFFRKQHENSYKKWQEIELNTSFRSAKEILQIVDAMSNTPLFQQAMIGGESDQRSSIKHQAWHLNRKGRVILWELQTADMAHNNAINSDERGQINELYQEFIEIVKKESESSEYSPNWLYKLCKDLKIGRDAMQNKREKREIIANAIADQIREWFSTQRVICGTDRVICPGDIMVLSRKRSDIQSLLLDKLRAMGIPANCDYNAANHILIRDLLTLAKFVIYPHDDFNLACLLRSDFIGLTPEELWLIRQNSLENSLYAAIQSEGQSASIISAKHDKIRYILAELRSGYQEFSEALGFFDWFFVAWLPRNNYNLSGEIINIAQYDGEIMGFFLKKLHYFHNIQVFSRSLCDFIYFMQRELVKNHKNSSENSENAIQLCTAHAAKGREADIVILADAYYSEESRQDLVIPTRDWFYLQSGSSDLPLPQAQKLYQSQQRYAENLRLLYVATTRARYELYAAGFQTKAQASNAKAAQKTAIIGEQPNWYEILAQLPIEKQQIS